MVKVNYIGVAVSIATFASLLLPWWSIRASGASIDVYLFGAVTWSVWSQDWVVNRLLTLDGTLLTAGLIVVFSGALALAGSLKFQPFLIAPFVLNPSAAFIFFSLMRSAIGKLAYGPFSGTNLIPVGPWGFAIGIGLCVLAGLASPISLIPFYWKRHKQQRETDREN